MNKNWSTARLGDLVSIKHGWPFKSEHFSDYQPGRPIVVSIGNFRYSGGFRFENTAIKAYTGAYPEEVVLNPNDILLVMTCQTAGGEILGIPGRIPDDGRMYLHNQRMGKVVITDQGKVAQNFLYWLFLTPEFNHHLVATASGAKILHTAPNRIESFQFRLPPLATQRKIAAILSAYDDLIENNTRRIAILEEMAQSLYREWFVHFRYPGHEKNSMVESALGMIPEGWEVKRLKYFGTIVTGKTPSTLVPDHFGKKYMPFIKTPDMHENMFCLYTADHLSELGVLSQKNKTIPPNSLCVNCIGALAGTVSITAVYAQTNQQINSIVLGDLRNREFLYFALRDLKQTIHRHGSNGATMVNLNKGKFESLKVVYPHYDVLVKYHELTQALFEEIRVLLQQNRNLRHTRDLLLPKLISGEIDVEGLDIEIGQEMSTSGESAQPVMVEEVVPADEQKMTLWE